tara:strand:- start:3040 stop:3879 length:840 start_codon:yes stop_codon:yes gene_type:complete
MVKQGFINKNNLGIMQGRLVDSPNKKIQCFPGIKWKKEFKIAKLNGFHLIEWTVNKYNLNTNPLLQQKKLKEIKKEKKNFNIRIDSLTCDYFMETAFFLEKNNSKKEEIINNLKKLIKHSQLLNIKFFIIPLVDKTSIKTTNHENQVIKLIKGFLPLVKRNSYILFETDYKPNKIRNFIKKFNTTKVKINYDTGNSASLGFNFDEEKNYYDLIKNVHIKDRKLKGSTVRLGLGNARLKKIINFFKKKKYRGNFILQTARNKRNLHVQEINLNRDYILQL